MRIKRGVRLQGLRPEAVLGMYIACDVLYNFGIEFELTSVTDGEHMRASLHYVGQAFDFRKTQRADWPRIVEELQLRLGDQFDVVAEENHVHVEFQPKG
jgi:hypothetical protein